jgi:hypothetical protein
MLSGVDLHKLIYYCQANYKILFKHLVAVNKEQTLAYFYRFL